VLKYVKDQGLTLLYSLPAAIQVKHLLFQCQGPIIQMVKSNVAILSFCKSSKK